MWVSALFKLSIMVCLKLINGYIFLHQITTSCNNSFGGSGGDRNEASSTSN